MTTVTLRITVQEDVRADALGRWLEGWIRDQWSGHGEPSGIAEAPEIHLLVTEARPPASGSRLQPPPASGSRLQPPPASGSRLLCSVCQIPFRVLSGDAYGCPVHGIRRPFTVEA